jgi:phosphatidylglycerol:prolipoprotein diacylglycerol transferase
MRTVLFEIPLFGFSLKIYSFGAAICIAFMQAFWLTRYLLRKEKRDPLWTKDAPEELKKALLEYVYDLGFGIMIGAIVGARLFHILRPSMIETYLSDPVKILKVWEGGLVFYGGFIGAFAVAFWMVWRKKLPPWHSGDFIAPSIAFGYAIGRWGCFMNGCCYGQPVSWGLRGISETRDQIPRHPTQLYESAASFALGFFLLWLLPRRAFRGQVFFTFVLLYAAERFLVEFIRDDPRGGLSVLTTSQWVALATLPLAIAGMVIQRRREPIREASPASSNA